MAKVKDLTGLQFGRLTVLEIFEKGKGKGIIWKCLCECGNLCYIPSARLNNGSSKSCGCLQKDTVSKLNTKHKLSNHKLYFTLNRMKGRCYNPKDKGFKDYGERGIKICNEWLDKKNGFKNFYNWSMQNGYKEGLSIDRIDVNGNYEPLNCRWVDDYVQLNNTRRNKKIEYNGEIHTVAEWARIKKLNPNTLRNRIDRNWSIEDALNTPTIKNKDIIIKGKQGFQKIVNKVINKDGKFEVIG